ncbi:MAG: M24 family metallopeptidase [Verrucomicrobiota bacterium]|nr:M24 family metallopeptidase [Verrucomicrobiota bacterium]
MSEVKLKTPQELALMRQSGKLLAQVFAYLDQHIRAGLSTMQINDLTERYIVDQLAARPASKGQYGFQYVLNSSVNHVVCHGVPSETQMLKAGDIVNIDPEGFVAIEGRAKRFAKIGGEMVSLTAVERVVEDIWPETPHAVISLSDPNKGERLVLVTEYKSGDRSDLVKEFHARGLSDIMIPAVVRAIDEMPVLGSGKFDYRKIEDVIDTD